jgi:hypothetical protein
MDGLRRAVRAARFAIPLCLAWPCAAFGQSASFVRGDANADGALDISDPVSVLVRLFQSGGGFDCEDAADANDDGAVDVSDAVRLLGLLFLGEPALLAPYPACGADPSGDEHGCTAYAPCGGGDLSSLSDAFDGAALDPSWTIFKPALIDVTIAGGALVIQATQSSLWFNASRGPLIHKLVSGDFKVTATVRARRASAPDQPPNQTIHLGGLMARNPSGDAGMPENYVFAVVGDDVDDLSVETKTTTDGASDFVGPSWPSGDAQLRICRTGTTMRLYKRAIGSTSWTLAVTYERPDFPAELQVGVIIYAPSSTPDLRVSFDEVLFGDVAGTGDCATD